jgi:hypothetical protein
MNGAAMLALQQLDSAIDQLTMRRTRIPEVGELGAATAARDAWQGELHAAQRQLAVAEGRSPPASARAPRSPLANIVSRHS